MSEQNEARKRIISVHQWPFIMKLDTNVFRGKPPSLEEGPMECQAMSDVPIYSTQKNNSYNRCIQFMKVILYLELIVFVGWMGCIFLTYYYQGDGYKNADRPYEGPELERSQESQGSSIDGNLILVRNNESSLTEDDMRTVIQKSESSTEPVLIDEKDDFVATETTTMSVIETNDKNMDGAMLFFAWLHAIEGSRNNWENSSSGLDHSARRIISSDEESNDGSKSSSQEEITLIEDANNPSSSQNYFDTIHKDNNHFFDIGIDDLSTPPFWPAWPDLSLPADYSDELTNIDKDLLPDKHNANWHFDFLLPDLVEHHLMQQAIKTNDQETASSSSFSEEADNSASMVKRSIESSSSEEKKDPAPKVKRSTDSSSSESDSTDSSSNENNETTTRATGKEKNCPRIRDDDGNTIENPDDIVNHIKRNWFVWLLKTPIPDCDEPSSAKTVTIDECGKFIIKCTPNDNDETSEVAKGTNNRDTRHVVENDASLEKCEESFKMMRKEFEKWLMDLIPGARSDPIIRKLHEELEKEVGFLIVRMIIEKSWGKEDRTEQQWLNSLLEVRHSIYNSTSVDHHRILEKNGIPTQEMANRLRHIVESLMDINSDCANVSAFSEADRLDFMIVKMAMERQKCMAKRSRIEAMEDSLAAELVTGESSDPTVTELRERFKLLVKALPREIASPTPHRPEWVPSDPADITAEQLRTFIHDLKQELANDTEDSSIQQRLEADIVSTQGQANQLRTILEYYLRDSWQCDMMTVFGFAGAPRYLHRASNRKQRYVSARSETRSARSSKIDDTERYLRDERAADPSPEPIIVTCVPDEDDVQLVQERQARLENWNEVVTNEPDLKVPLLDTIDAELKAENTSEIILEHFRTDYGDLLIVANEFIGNSSSELRRQGYELVRDIIIETQKLDRNDSMWKDRDMMDGFDNFTSCIRDMAENLTVESIFMGVVKAGEVLNLRYSEDYSEKQCRDPYQPVYGKLTYIGEKPEDSFRRVVRHIFDAIIKLYFKIHDPEALQESRCSSTDLQSTTEPSIVEGSSGVFKRSIRHPGQSFDNTVHLDDKMFTDRDDTGSFEMMNLHIDGQPSNHMFLARMETLASHIDRLHEIYWKYNELNDDYVSKELPIESPMNYEY